MLTKLIIAMWRKLLEKLTADDTQILYLLPYIVSSRPLRHFDAEWHDMNAPTTTTAHASVLDLHEEPPIRISSEGYDEDGLFTAANASLKAVCVPIRASTIESSQQAVRN